MDYVLEDLKKYSNSPYFDILINCILVHNGARTGALLEFNTDLLSNNQWYQQHTDDIIKHLHLKKIVDPRHNFRWFIMNYNDSSKHDFESDSSIAKFLGFYAVDHDFANCMIDRTSGSIFEIKTHQVIYTEVCESLKINMKQFENSLKSKVAQFNSSINFMFQFDFEITELKSISYLFEMYQNITYVQNHIDSYIAILLNYYNPKTIFDDGNMILNHYDVFKFIMSKIIDRSFDELYSKFKYGSAEYNQFVTKLLELEKHPEDFIENFRDLTTSVKIY